jgi:glycosyltransferase involved in cell wall biosynthesis
MKFTFVIPCYNARPNLPDLLHSINEQKDADWEAIFIDDMSNDGTVEFLAGLSDPRIKLIVNSEKKFALRNIVETSRNLSGIVAVIDGDDQLCNEHTVSIVKSNYTQPGMVVWTSHRWDINGLNISRALPDRVNPYQFNWCSSHLRTFDASLLASIPESNFKDHEGRWFERGYDQALMLPLLYKATVRKFIPEVCYLYKIDSCSMSDREWAESKQLRTVNFVRARGFLDS